MHTGFQSGKSKEKYNAKDLSKYERIILKLILNRKWEVVYCMDGSYDRDNR
jgi:hypothetical protein